MKSFSAKFSFYFTMNAQERALKFMKDHHHLSMGYDIKYIDEYEIYESHYFDRHKNMIPILKEYHEKIDLVCLTINANHLSNLRDWIDEIEQLTAKNFFDDDCYRRCLDVFVYASEDCEFDLSLTASNLFFLTNNSFYFQIHYRTNKD